MAFDFPNILVNIFRLFNRTRIYRHVLSQTDYANTKHNESNISGTFMQEDQRFLQPIWDLRLGREDIVASPLFPVILSVMFYFSLCAPFMIIDLYGRKWKWIQKYKIRPELEVTSAQCRDTLTLTFWNHILFVLPSSCAQWVWTPLTPLPELAPTMFDFIWHQFAGLLIFDFQYFVWHWTHHKIRFLYKRVHAVHHRYHSPFCWVTQYLHPWELVTVGFLTTTNTWFFNCHPLTTWSYMLTSIMVSVEDHIGFDFPFTLNHLTNGFFGGAPKHDMHHMKPHTNYQPFFNHWDKIFGTFSPVMAAGGIKPLDLLEYERKRNDSKKRC